MMLKRARNIRGLNDIEVYFWHLVKELQGGASFREAIRSFRILLHSSREKNKEGHPGKSRPYISLNVIFCDGRKLCAYCKYDKEDERMKSLCSKVQPVFQLTQKRDSTNLIVCSERTDPNNNWECLRSQQLLTAEASRKKMKISLTVI